jgi:hypothetical protein
MIPATIRNNNPGGMYPGPSSRKFGAKTFETLRSRDGTHKIATFPTKVHGAAAMFDLLGRAYCDRTVEQAVTKWCGGHYVSTYLKVLQQRGGIPPSQMIDKSFLRDHQRSIPLVRAMAWQEAGQEYPLSEQDWLAAHTMAHAAGQVAPEWNPNNDVPTPKPETRQHEAVIAAAKTAGPAVAVGGGTVAVSSPPDLSVLTSWQSALQAAQGLGKWALEAWPLVLCAAAVYVVVAHVLPAWRRA